MHSLNRHLQPPDYLNGGGLVLDPVDGHHERDQPVDVGALCRLVDAPAAAGVLRDGVGGVLGELGVIGG